ncbi:hypothetical protein BD310DRAFT_1003631 [Dichomitus squalens]|uniref:DUF6533 domain-containing protein n=1 Tax=Dichomitus squalens TaxID=114155 RepID=A0A4Q9PEQ0_9APHY|nr:hypothetical protein BD310DRAFT_1003631 [Dichomitus squalens]
MSQSGTTSTDPVFIFDSMITTAEELRCFWGRKITGAAILFWLNKYMTMLCLVWDLATGLSISDKSCDLSVRGDAAVDYLLFIVLAAFTAIRVYALRRSLTLCAITAVLSLVPLGINMAYFGFGMTGENIFPFGCTEMDDEPTSLSHILIAADGLAIGATWFTLGLPNSVGQGVKADSIIYVGTIYFLTLAVLNSLHLAFTLLSVDIDAVQPVSVVANFTTPLSAILVSRLLLHLQSASLRAVGSIPSSHISSLHLNRSLVFERVVGSLGASIVAEDYLKEDYGGGDDGERADEEVV